MKLLKHIILLMLCICHVIYSLGQNNRMQAAMQTVNTINKSVDSTVDNISLAMAAIASQEPFLTGYYYASSNTSKLPVFANRVEEISRRKAVEHEGEKGSRPNSFSFPEFPGNARLALFFRNWPPDHGNNIFEYKLVDMDERNGDTSIPWKKSSSVIIVPRLAYGTNYMLMVRYIGEGNKISAYFFKTYSVWSPYLRVFKKNIGFIIGLLIIINLLLLLRYLNTKRRQRQYQLELKSLFAQLNPHFVFNSLSSIQGLMNNNEIEKANQYLSGFSGLLRTTLDKGGKEVIPLSEEIGNLQNYIHFEQLRFNFKFEKDVEPYLPMDEINVMPLLAQPLIENSVKHGISGLGEKGLLSIRLYTVEHDLFMAIKDNGKGFDVEEYKAGYGVDLVKKRIAAYNKWHRKTNIVLNMKSEPGNTVTIIQFQNWLPK
ncbi:MAG: hypothetical protein DI598_15495 [Pseudopedobacter saltans]|uniref:Signal transduction histidine kinase internal region domain-containing protein n=1 Tax=Pseudopedobacter saltans TaxID=151895 RepID=A0A2W5EQW8_9SPHI|nr:MAG: hypothetical protein DI598_15495 [Pseudopedobacter saltans]